jgi:anti-sigma-K factor RskA
VKLARHRKLDALVVEYLLGTLRSSARLRFERAMREEPFVATRVTYWQQQFALRFSKASEVQPSPLVWTRIASDLKLSQHETPWYAKLALSGARGWSFAAALGLVFVLGWFVLQNMQQSSFQTIAKLSGDAAMISGNSVVASLSKDGRKVAFKADRALAAETQKSFEVWLLPKEGGAPISLAVLASLNAQIEIPSAQVGRLSAGAKLAVSVEPRGGSPTGAPTGPIILVGAITS